MAPRLPKKIATYTDECGDTRTIHKRPNGELSVAQEGSSVSQALSRAIGEHVGRRIREERITKKLSQRELMARAGITGGKMRAREIESTLLGGPRLGTLYAIARVLGLSVADLLPSLDDAFRSAGIETQIVFSK